MQSHARQCELGEAFAELAGKLEELEATHRMSDAESLQILLSLAKIKSDQVISNIDSLNIGIHESKFSTIGEDGGSL